MVENENICDTGDALFDMDVKCDYYGLRCMENLKKNYIFDIASSQQA